MFAGYFISYAMRTNTIKEENKKLFYNGSTRDIPSLLQKGKLKIKALTTKIVTSVLKLCTRKYISIFSSFMRVNCLTFLHSYIE
jgi:predicted DNA-binding ribbon-helix-helix protein